MFGPTSLRRILIAVGSISRGRYSNLYSLLREQLDEDQYMKIVEQNLVDIQAGDILYQIFTAPIMNAAPEEAPFLEFIRECAPISVMLAATLCQ